MKVAVVGGGLFGTTAAIALAKHGLSVTLFEKEPDILQAASGINQFRLHRGYHYPRSVETAISSRDSEASFRKEYGAAIMENLEHYYLIAAKNSKVSGKEFADFCQLCGLEIIKTKLPLTSAGTIDEVFKVQESLIDPMALKNLIAKRLRQQNVNVVLNTIFRLPATDFDLVINCTYASLNSILPKRTPPSQKYQFELCEKPLVKLPKKFAKKSVVVMDGPFFCFDPYGQTGFHLIGNVVHAIHATNVGFSPKIPSKFKPLLNRGLIKNPAVTNFRKFIKVATTFIPEFSEAVHVGSFYTVRTVLPNLDATDARPTIVTQVNDRLIQVFSGKLGNCVEAADQVVKLAGQVR